MQESGEMYLETILIIGKEKNTVRSIDIVDRMGFSKPSVSKAMARLKADECIVMDSRGYIALTEKGREIAEKMFERHNLLTDILKYIGVSEETAESDACKMEHDISEETIEAIKKQIQNLK